jgi:tungstate transport system substrate-binding protein
MAIVRHAASGLLAAVAALLLSLSTIGAACAGDQKTVRLAVVNTPYFSGLITALIEDFKKTSGYDVSVVSGSDVYDRARAGEADLVISHYGKAEVERFVLDGFGRWPHMVFSNQLVLAGPKADPAHIRGMHSASEALRKIAEAKAPFLPNALPGIDYVTALLWEEAGKPDKQGWFLEASAQKGRAIGLAEEKGAYVIWGALPFLRYQKKHSTSMEVMVSQDPALQRVMAAIVVNPEKVPGVNAEGAEALQKYLMTASAQAKIAAFRSPGSDLQFWWPAARNNASEGLDE